MMNNSSIPAFNTQEISSRSPSKKLKKQASLMPYRFMIAYRFVLALIGGYVLASLSAILIAHHFAEYRGSAAMSATLIALTLWACAFIWVFMVNKTLKASLGIIIPSLALYVMYKLLGN